MATSGKTKLAVQRSAYLSHSVTVGRFSRHEDAQSAVDLLAERGFPVQALTIVGTDLRQVEHVVGTLSYAKVALSGALQGAFFGVLMAFLMVLFAGDNPATAFLTAVPLGIAFWMIMAVLSYSRSGRGQNYTAVGHLLAGSYELVCAPQEAQEARRLLGGQSSGSPLRPRPGQHGMPGQQRPGAGAGPGTGAEAPGASHGSPWDGTRQGPVHAGPQQGSYPSPEHQAPGHGATDQPSRDQHPAGQYPEGQQGAGAPSRDGAPAPSGDHLSGNNSFGNHQGSQAQRPEDPQNPAETRRRTQANDYQDLPDGRPRFGIREEDAPAAQQRPSDAGEAERDPWNGSTREQ